MKKIALVFVVCLLMLGSCSKRNCPIIGEQLPNDKEPLTQLDSNRNDVDPAPIIPWHFVDTSSFSNCEKRIWGYTKNMYPLVDSNFWNYNIYSIAGEPENELKRRKWQERYIYFFLDTIQKQIFHDQSQPCQGIDSSFFLKTIGEPTCVVHNHVRNELTYLYAFKMKYRRGPCPNIFDPGSPYDWKCYALHFDHCSTLKIIFSERGKQISTILFFGGG
jgi:hypothetical protein